MKVLACHNYYQQRGGEDECFEGEVQLLRSRGVEVSTFTRHNDDVRQMSRWKVSAGTIWSKDSYGRLRAVIRQQLPDVMHFTNTFPLISPAAYAAARSERVPIVQALHNYRLMCPSAVLFRNGRVCEDCVGKFVPWPGVLHKCYRGSLSASAVVGGMLAWHRLMRTWRRNVDLFYTQTEFARRKLIQGGIREDRIVVKPNFIEPDPGLGGGQGRYAVFVGRLDATKGVETLLDAWTRYDAPIPLNIIGDGPMGERVAAVAGEGNRIRWLGRLPLEQVLSTIGDALLLVMPSIWYETFGRTVMEAFAKGTPVVASRLGAMNEIVQHGTTGLTFEPGNPAELAACVRRLAQDAAAVAEMRRAARRAYEEKYMAECNFQALMDIYRRAIERRANRSDMAARQTAGEPADSGPTRNGETAR